MSRLSAQVQEGAESPTLPYADPLEPLSQTPLSVSQFSLLPRSYLLKSWEQGHPAHLFPQDATNQLGFQLASQWRRTNFDRGDFERSAIETNNRLAHDLMQALVENAAKEHLLTWLRRPVDAEVRPMHVVSTPH